MNKDALLATVIGFGIGLLITGALLVGPGVIKNLPQIKLPSIKLQTQKPTGSPSPTPTPFAVTIESPLPESIENNDTLLVSGVTSPGAVVVIGGPLDETVIALKNDGKYAGKITLVEGKNDVTVTSYAKGKQTSQTVTIYYTPESL